MTRPPPQDELPDEFTQRYRRASDLDRSGPSAHVRDAILAHARGNAAEQARQKRRASAWTTSAWTRKAAASLAVIGLVGALTSQIFRTRQPDSTVAVRAMSPPSRNPAMRPVAPSAAAPPTPAPAPLASREATLTSTRSMMAAAKASSSASADSNFSEALARRQSTENNQWPALTLAALRSTYPDLYIAPGSAEPVRIAMVLNKDGTVYKSAIEVRSAATQSPSEQLRRALGSNPDSSNFPRAWSSSADPLTNPMIFTSQSPSASTIDQPGWVEPVTRRAGRFLTAAAASSTTCCSTDRYSI